MKSITNKPLIFVNEIVMKESSERSVIRENGGVKIKIEDV